MRPIDAVLSELGDITVETQPQRVRRRSRDFYWYSPVLKRQLEHVTADAVAIPSSEEQVIEVARSCYRHGVPLTVRGGGTGNYGQAMPLEGGIVLDLSEFNHIKEIRLGRVRAEAGAKLADIDEECRSHSQQELRIHPSTHKTGTIGGYVAGGSSGVGSITWGLLRDRGNILGARVITMEEEPRILELHGADIQKINHAYGTNGIVTELEMPLAPASRWAGIVVAFDQFDVAVRFCDALAHEDAILKKLVTTIAAPVGNAYLRPDLIAPNQSVALLMVADIGLVALGELIEHWGGRVLEQRYQDELVKGELPIFEYAWNHTTLHAIKRDRTITYLQTLFPPPNHVDSVLEMAAHFGDEVPIHLEFVRFAGAVACFGLQLVRFTTEERLQQIMDHHEQRGCPIFNPHAYTLEEGGMKKVDQVQLAFKREADPKGLLNPGKMIGWSNPDFDQSQNRRFLYENQ